MNCSVCLYVGLSICPSVCLSVLHTFFNMSHQHIITNFSWVIVIGGSYVHAKGQDQRSKVKVTEVKTQLNHIQTVTSVWTDIWQWNDAQSFTWLWRGVLLFFQGHPSTLMVTWDKKMLILTWIWHFLTVSPIWIDWWLWNDAQNLMCHRRGALLLFLMSKISNWS